MEQFAGLKAGWRCVNKATLFSHPTPAVMSPLHGHSFIIYRPALEVSPARMAHIFPFGV